MGYKFGGRSVNRTKGVTEVLLNTAHEALGVSMADMTIPWRGGVRTAKQQHEIFLNGNSRADGYEKKSYHQSGNALDVIPYKNSGGQYFGVDAEFIAFAKLMFMVFENEKEAGEIAPNVYLHWGGFWGAKDLNGNGIMESLHDKTGWDKAHWELRSYPQKNVLKL